MRESTSQTIHPKTDCFAYRKNGCREECSALKQMLCKIKGACVFYKTAQEERDALLKINETDSIESAVALYSFRNSFDS